MSLKVKFTGKTTPTRIEKRANDLGMLRGWRMSGGTTTATTKTTLQMMKWRRMRRARTTCMLGSVVLSAPFLRSGTPFELTSQLATKKCESAIEAVVVVGTLRTPTRKMKKNMGTKKMRKIT